MVEYADIRHALLRQIPAVDKLLEGQEVLELIKQHSRSVVVKAVQRHLCALRRKIAEADPRELEGLQSHAIRGEDIEREIAALTSPLLRRVVNATGVILHTNLGRSPLPRETLGQLEVIAGHYSNVEYDLTQGTRGSRYAHVHELICELTGAEAAFVVNNNAAAVLLALNTLAQGREAIVSRGELIEIGGSFRIPDIMSRSGAIMVEVGTTNKTHLADYERAIHDTSGVLVKVHTSNYKVVGFTSQVSLADLVPLAHRHHLPLINDLGSGCLIDFSPFGLEHEPTVQEVVQSGVDVVTFSGDKLLGGPQAGIVAGNKKVVAQLIKNPLNRALRIDKLTLAALESTLRLYLDPETVIRRIPALRMITCTADAIGSRARAFRERVRPKLPGHVMIDLKEDTSQVGGGALPLQSLPTWVVVLTSPRIPAERLEERLRQGNPPVIARIQRDQLLIDLRTVEENEEDALEAALIGSCSGEPYL